MCNTLLLLDELSGSKYDRFEVKQTASKFIKTVCPVIDHDISILVQHVNGKALNNLLNQHDNLMIELTKHPISDFPVLAGLLKLYRENPEYVLQQLDITIEVK